MGKPASPKAGGLRRFALIVLVFFFLIVAGLLTFTRLFGDGGSLPFLYEGFN